MQKRFTVTITILLSTFIFGKAQIPSLKFKELNEFNNLSSQFTTCVGQDQSGYIWIGTIDGLNRYDGHEIKTFRRNAPHYSLLSGNHIRTFLFDEDNRIWIGTLSGISLYLPNFENFKDLSGFDNFSELATSDITNISQNSRGTIFIATSNAVYEVDEENTAFLKRIAINDGIITSMSLSDDNTIWIGQNSDDILSCFSGRNNYKSNQLPSPIRKYLEEHENLTITRTLYFKEQLWIGTQGNGIIRYDFSTKEIDSFLGTSYESSIVFLNNDKKGNVWTCSYSGLKIFDSETNRFHDYYIDSESHSSIKRNPIGIFEDRQGSYWVYYADKGVQFAPEPKGFQTFSDNKKSYWPLHNKHILSIQEDSNGNLWSGSYNGGITVFNWESGSVSEFRFLPSDPYSLGHGSVFEIFRDKQNTIWVGTFQGGLQKYIPEKNHFISYIHDSNNSQSISGNDVRSIEEDSIGNLWLAIHGKGVDYFDKVTGNFLHFTPENSNLSSEWVNQVILDNQNQLWVATTYGLNKFIPEQNKFKVYLKNSLNPKSNNIKSNEINAIHETPEGVIWVGTPNGLQSYNPENESFSNTKSNILNIRFICDIANDANGLLWVSTHSGLFRYNPETGRTFNFDSSDDLPTNNFNNRSSFFDGKRFLFFGSPEGLISFDPNEININTTPPQIVLSEFKVFNRPVTKYGPDLPLKSHINSASQISLNYAEKFFSIEYTAINYLDPENNQYAYKLEGFEDQWNYVNNKREAIYTNLNPGKYTFRVKASNSNGVWNDEGQSIDIFIKPPWNKSTWFRVLVIVIFAISAFVTFHLRTSILRNQKQALIEQVKERTKRLNEKNKILESHTHELNIKNEQLVNQKQTIEIQAHELREQAEKLKNSNKNLQNLNNTKDRLFSIIAHDVRSPFNTIIGFSSLLQEMAEDNNTELVTEYAKYINDSSYQIMALLENLLYWARSQTNEIIARYGQTSVKRIFDDNLTLINESIIKKEISLDVSELDYSIEFIGDEEMLRTIVRNLTSNAIKFTPSRGKISISSKVLDHQLEIKITDTGQGMTPKKMEEINKNNLTSTKGTHGEKGSGLGLAITKEFIEQHHGEFTISSAPGKGSKFGFRIPLNPNNIKPEMK